MTVGPRDPGGSSIDVPTLIASPYSYVSYPDRHMLRCAARSSLSKEITRILGISERKVAHHLQHVYDKVGVSASALSLD
jgi:FixJ family two-component response regulator